MRGGVCVRYLDAINSQLMWCDGFEKLKSVSFTSMGMITDSLTESIKTLNFQAIKEMHCWSSSGRSVHRTVV